MTLASIDELLAFDRIAETGGFTSAAKGLGLTTNAVSLRLQKLEDRLGVRLMVRTTRSLSLTDEGRIFLERASSVLTELESAQEEVRPEGRTLRGTVRVAVTAAIATAPLLERLKELLDAHPELRVQTLVHNRLVNLAAEGLDIALVVGAPPQSAFVGRLLGRATWVLAAAPSYLEKYGRPKVPTDLTVHRAVRFLSQPPQSEWLLVDRRGRETSVPVSGSYEADDSRTLGDAIYAGLGIGLRPLGECVRAEQEKRLERVLPGFHFQPLDVYALLPKGRIRVPRVAACLEALRAAVLELC